MANGIYPATISQKSNLNLSDSVVLTTQQDDILPMYSGIEIYRKGKLIFNYRNNEVEIRGFSNSFFTEYFNKKKSFDYIFKCDDRPNPDKYLIVRTDSDTTFLLGISENSTGTIFGDIDLDGYFEIGGQKTWIEGNEKPIITVFRIDNNFPNVQEYSDCMSSAILNKLKTETSKPIEKQKEKKK